jgi:hypothetical protein
MGTLLACVLIPALLPQHPAAPVAIADATASTSALESGLVLVPPGNAPGSGWGLGDGGVAAADPSRAGLPGGRGECTTPGGVSVRCQLEGVKLEFPSGRELLFAPDGYLHLRDGSAAGPFGGGVELRLLDGSTVRIDRNGSRRTPLSEVVVAAPGGAAARLWWRRGAVHEPARSTWNGDRLFCLGDGGSLYRALALGPVVTLQRMLAPRGGRQLPEALLALDVGSALGSLRLLADSRARHTEPEAIAEVDLVLAESARVWPSDEPPPPRVSTDPLQFLLRSGYDLRFAVEGADVRLSMARHQQKPFVEWQLGYGASVRGIVTPAQQVGHPVALPDVADELQPRLERNQLVQALQVLAKLRGGGR